MATITGARAVEVAAGVERCRAIVTDIERVPEWQSTLTAVAVLERDDDGRPILADTTWDARMQTLAVTLRVAHAPGRIEWRQERGDLSSLFAAWSFDPLDDDRSRVEYELIVEPTFMLGQLLRAVGEGTVRDHLLADAVDGLRVRAESGA